MCTGRNAILFLIPALLLVFPSSEHRAAAQETSSSPVGSASAGGRGDKASSAADFIISPRTNRGVPEWWRNADVQKRLELRPGQIADIELSWRQHVSAAQPVREVLSRKWQAIDRAIADHNVTPDELRQLFMIAEALRSDLNTSRVVTLYKIFLTLDPTQRIALNKWLTRSSVDLSPGRKVN